VNYSCFKKDIIRNISFVCDFSFKLFFYGFFVFSLFSLGFLFKTGDFNLNFFFNFYTGVFFHFSDLFFLISLFFYGIVLVLKNRFYPHKFTIYLIIFVLSFFVFLFLFHPNIHFLFGLIRFLEIVSLFFLVFFKQINSNHLISISLFFLFFNSIFGLYQFVTYHSIGFYVLGEPYLNREVSSLANIKIFSTSFLRAYGLTPHPNILAFISIVGLLLVLYCWKTNIFLNKFFKNYFLSGILILLSAVCFFSFSKSMIFVLMTLFFVGLYILLKSKTRYIILFFYFFGLLVLLYLLKDYLFSENFNSRIFYLIISLKMFFYNIFGVGFNNFTVEMSKYSEILIYPWYFQPVHNFYLLILNEFGIFVLFLPLYFVYFFRFKNRERLLYFKKWRLKYVFLSLVFLFIISSFVDHYLFTSFQSQILSVFLLSVLIKDFVEQKNLYIRL